MSNQARQATSRQIIDTLSIKPILLFDAAMRSQWFYLKRLLLIILTFAFVVVVCNTLIFGILIQHTVIPLAQSLGGGNLIGWTLSHGFTLGAVLGSTDPVSVISFMEVGRHNLAMFSICLSLSLSDVLTLLAI